MSGETFKGVFEKMQFPEYVYREYPKMVKRKDGSEMIVNNHAEELRAIDEIVMVSDHEKLERDKVNLEKLLAESQEKLQKLEEELKEKEEDKHSGKPIVAKAKL